MSDPTGVHVALLGVLGELESIPKNGTAPASQGGYAFRRFEDVATALKPLFVAHGLNAPIARCLDRVESNRQLGNGKTMYGVSLHIEWTITDMNGDSVVGSMWGEGTDMGDKATQKAVTASLKSFLTPAFLIADEGDDSEGHDTPDTAPPPARTALEGWASVEDMDEKHAAFQAGVASLTEDQRKEVGEFRAAQQIPWPMTTAQMEKMLEKVKMITSFDAAQNAADGPMGQDVSPGSTIDPGDAAPDTTGDK